MRRGVDPDRPAARETPADRVARIRAAVAASQAAARTSPPALVVQATMLSTRQMGQMIEVMERHAVEYVVISGSAVAAHDPGTTSTFPRPFTRGLLTPFVGGTVTTMTDQGQLDLAFTIHAFPRGYEVAGRLREQFALGPREP